MTRGQRRLLEIPIPNIRRYSPYTVKHDGPGGRARLYFDQAWIRLDMDDRGYSGRHPFNRSGLRTPWVGAASVRGTPLQLPEFDLLRGTIEGWREQAEQEFRSYCEGFLAECKRQMSTLVELPRARGKGDKRSPAPVELRFEWAIRHDYLGESIPALAGAKWNGVKYGIGQAKTQIAWVRKQLSAARLLDS